MKQFDERGSNLIFLIAPPGSGASQLQALLSNHPSVHSVPDSWIMLHPLYALKREGLEADYEAPRARSALDSFLSKLPGGEQDYIASLRAMASVLYSRALSISGKTLFLDNTPRYYHIIPELRRVFPRARFIFLLRNPLAALTSVLGSIPAEVSSKFKNTPDYADLKNAPSRILAALKSSGSEHVIVRYEQLQSNPQDTLQVLCQYLGLHYDAVMLSQQACGLVEIGIAGELPLAPLSLQQKTLAQEYLQGLGEPLIRDLGYHYSELQSVLHRNDSDIGEVHAGMDACALNEVGEQLFAHGDIDAAMNSFQASLKIDSLNPITLNNISVVYWQRGNLPEALSHLARGMEIAPDNRELIKNGAHILCAADRLGDAIDLCRSFLTEYPQDEDVQYIVESLQVQSADSIPSLAITTAPDSAWSLNIAGESYFKIGNLAAAQKAFEQAYALAPQDVDILNNLGVLFWHQGAADLSLNYLYRALELQPDHRETVVNYASICNVLGKNRKSGAMCEKYLEYYPDDDQVRGLLSDKCVDVPKADVKNFSIGDLNYEGERRFSNGDVVGAKAIFLEAFAIDPRNGTTCNNLGVLARNDANIDEALMYLKRALEIEPDNAEFVNNCVQLYLDASRVKDAVELCASFIHSHPEYADSETVEYDLRNVGAG